VEHHNDWFVEQPSRDLEPSELNEYKVVSRMLFAFAYVLSPFSLLFSSRQHVYYKEFKKAPHMNFIYTHDSSDKKESGGTTINFEGPRCSVF